MLGADGGKGSKDDGSLGEATLRDLREDVKAIKVSKGPHFLAMLERAQP